MLKRLVAVVPALALGVGIGWTLAAQQAPPAKNWKDQAEYDMANAASKQTDAKARLPLIDKWKQAYPQTEYSDERQDMYLETYRVLGQCRGAFDAASEILKTRPNHEFSMQIIVGCARQFNPLQPADQDVAERVATY